jgi:hypothetical protein
MLFRPRQLLPAAGVTSPTGMGKVRCLQGSSVPPPALYSTQLALVSLLYIAWNNMCSNMMHTHDLAGMLAKPCLIPGYHAAMCCAFGQPKRASCRMVAFSQPQGHGPS